MIGQLTGPCRPAVPMGMIARKCTGSGMTGEGRGGGGERKNHCKSRGSMTVVDPLLQKTDQSAHVPFEHEFKVGSMPLHHGDKRALTHTRRSDLAVPVTGICVPIRYSADTRGKCNEPASEDMSPVCRNQLKIPLTTRSIF